MKKLLLLVLLFSIACNKDSSNTAQTGSGNETTTPTVGNGGTGTPPRPTTPTTPTVPSTPSSTQTWNEEFMDLINNHRASIGLRALIANDDMDAIAKTHSVNMANGSVAFGHDGFSARCSAARTALGGGNWCGENVAWGQKTPQAAFTAWMGSPGHKANIESTRATHSGFGFALNSSGRYYWTQIFTQL